MRLKHISTRKLVFVVRCEKNKRHFPSCTRNFPKSVCIWKKRWRVYKAAHDECWAQKKKNQEPDYSGQSLFSFSHQMKPNETKSKTFKKEFRFVKEKTFLLRNFEEVWKTSFKKEFRLSSELKSWFFFFCCRRKEWSFQTKESFNTKLVVWRLKLPIFQLESESSSLTLSNSFWASNRSSKSSTKKSSHANIQNRRTP